MAMIAMFCSPSPVMMTYPNEWKILEWDETPQTNRENNQRCKVLALTIQSLLRLLDGLCHRPLPLFPFSAPSVVPSWLFPCFRNICRLPLLRLFVTSSALSALFVFPFLNDRDPAFILLHWLFSWPKTDSKIEQKSAAKSSAFILIFLFSLLWKYQMAIGRRL